MIVGLAPFYAQPTAVHHHFGAPWRPAGECSSHRRGAGSRAAGLSDAAATLPHTGAQAAVASHLHELDVAPLGESGMIFEQRPLGGYLADVVGEHHVVRIAHRDERADAGVGGFVELARVVEHGLDHIHRNRSHLAAMQMQPQHLDARQREQAYGGLVGQPALVEILAYAARSVAAHHGFRAVGVEDAHRKVGLGHRRALYQHQSVGAYTLVAVAPEHRQPLWLCYWEA